MGEHEDKIEIIRKYASQVKSDYNPFHIKGEIPSKKIDMAISKFAFGLKRETIIGFYDITLSGNGRLGFIFTDDKVYYREITLEKPRKLWYSDIASIELVDKHKSDCDNELIFHLTDGDYVTWSTCYFYKKPLKKMFEELIEYDNKVNTDIDFTPKSMNWVEMGGVVDGIRGTSNRLFEEEKFNARQGHGFAAESANDLYDKLTGHQSKIVGDNNARNGADRIVDGVEIQSKYCETGSRCINECFENGGKGAFRYMNSKGKPMQIEVPSDKYEAAVKAMEEKIRRGQVEGINDPKEAKGIVKKGHFTYNQAKNIAKFGTVESITYDAINGAITAIHAFGVTFMLTFAIALWNGDDLDTALKSATFSSLKVEGTKFVTQVIASQLSKAGLNSALVNSSEAIVSLMGPKASAFIVNAFRSGSNIYGAAAMKSAAKLLRTNVITTGVTIAVVTSVDVVNIFRGRISGKQLFKNLATTAASIGGGIAAGAAVGSIVPGLGTFVGGVIGGFVASKASSKIMDEFIEDDADEMVRIIENEFSSLAVDYLLNQTEVEKIVDRLSDKLDGKTLKDMFASEDRYGFANELLVPIIEAEVEKRPRVYVPEDNQINNCLRNILEDMADAESAALA